MRVLLVYPEMPDTIYALKHFIRITGKKAAFPPLGLLTVASLLPEKWEKRLCDLNVRPLSGKDLQWADYVFLSAMNVQEESVREVIEICKQAGVKIVAGGPLFTHEYERFENVAHFILNEAEITLPLFLDDLAKGDPKPIYKTTAFADVTRSPLPMFELIDMKHYLYAIVQYSRGCPYLCDFCDVTALFGRVPRTKTPDQMISELEAINRNRDVNMVLFADDNLIGNKRVLKSDLLPALIDWRKKTNPGFYMATQLTVNLIDDDELTKMLTDTGFQAVFIGIETPNEESLKVAHKNQNLKRNLLNTIRSIHEKGFIIFGGFIVGFDTDTDRSFEAMREFIQESGIPMPIVNVLKAPPGTELYERMKREKRLIKPFAFDEGDTNIMPVMGEEKLYNGFLNVIEGIYSPEASYQRVRHFMNQYRFPKRQIKIKSHVGWNELKIGLRVFYFLGVRSRNRSRFWGLLLWTLFHKRKYLDKAIIFSMFNYQMEETYKHIRLQVEDQLRQIEAEKMRA